MHWNAVRMAEGSPPLPIPTQLCPGHYNPIIPLCFVGAVSLSRIVFFSCVLRFAVYCYCDTITTLTYKVQSAYKGAMKTL